jgi:GAF domain-containing protein
MSTFAVAHKTYSFRLNAAEVAITGRDLAFILGSLLGRVNAGSAVVYRADTEKERDEFRAIAARVDVAPRIAELAVTLGMEATAALRQSDRPFQTSADTDPRFAGLPEVLQYGLKRLLVFPLRGRDGLLGIMTIGRAGDEGFDSRAIQFALPVARIVEAVIERDALQEELKNRKLMERAKGILQRDSGISEEEAYLQLRRKSRQLRLPVADIARKIISEAVLRKTA